MCHMAPTCPHGFYAGFCPYCKQRWLLAIAGLFVFASFSFAQDKRQQVINEVERLTRQIEQLQASIKPNLTADERFYNESYALAKMHKQWLVIYVNVGTRPITDTQGVLLTRLNGDATPRIVTYKVGNERGDTWTPAVDTQRLQEHMGILPILARQVQPSASFFEKSGLRAGEVRIADVERTWPVGLSFLSDMETYPSATRTQITFRRWSGYIGSEPRGVLESKWLVPGNLAGVNGWSSTLYKSRNARASVFLVRQDPSDGSSAVTWGRSYPNGSVFADVLRNASGQVFEARVAEKQNGRWERFIAFKDVSARPHGYSPPRSFDCTSCHGQAGVSAYGGAAIPGADGIISEAIEPVENQRTVQGGYGVNLN